MKVRMKTNLGTIHARQIGVDAGKCRDGMEPEVSESAGQWLVRNGKAEELAEMQAIPAAPMQAVPPAPIQPSHEPKPATAKAKNQETSK